MVINSFSARRLDSYDISPFQGFWNTSKAAAGRFIDESPQPYSLCEPLCWLQTLASTFLKTPKSDNRILKVTLVQPFPSPAPLQTDIPAWRGRHRRAHHTRSIFNSLDRPPSVLLTLFGVRNVNVVDPSQPIPATEISLPPLQKARLGDQF